MASRLDEIETGVNTHIHTGVATRLLFLAHIFVVLLVNKINYRAPAVPVVDIVAESRCINHGQIHLEHLFFQLYDDYGRFSDVGSIYLLCQSTCQLWLFGSERFLKSVCTVGVRKDF